ncbi:hypothetical protein GALMADRAFT_217161 [Galerina marginata CBS 339.88]|uniref:Uncharacterized protein n=1 Tax=Galerina marginata (strain CBS 339.88) TaxID=685588 RepID=A0A067SEI1_GALM3|nr:hypothetical protein GALMADRAFT_217161 [Galerina marginata CBS 339.88]
MDEDPTEDELKAVDDSKPDQELPAPNAKNMSPEEYKVASKTYKERQDLIVHRTEQIARWFSYRHEKEIGNTSKEPDLDDPITILTCRLTGASSFKPRKPIACNLWAKLNKETIDEAFAKSSKPGRVDIRLRQEVTRGLFNALPSVDRGFWNLRADQEHRRQLVEWEDTIGRPASKDPEARQKSIDGITSFMQPILDLVFEFTGMPTTFIMGGPEPADRGRLNIISLHSGSVQGPVKMNFGEAEQAGYKEQVVLVFSSFLRKCFTCEDCRAAALPFTATSLLAIIDDHSINYDHAVGDGDDSNDDTPLAPPNAPSTRKVNGPPASRNPPATSQVPSAPTQSSSSSKHLRKNSQHAGAKETADSSRERRGVAPNAGDDPSQSLTRSHPPHVDDVDGAADQATRPSSDGFLVSTTPVLRMVCTSKTI